MASSTPPVLKPVGYVQHEYAAAGTATGRCVFTVVQARPAGGVRPILSGRYDDRFARVDGEWRFVERVIRPDLAGDLSDHMRG